VTGAQHKRTAARTGAGPAAPIAASAATEAPAGLPDEAIVRLKQLAELHQSGILTDAEFAEQKARILVG
jgi:hypothetical protein